MFRQATKLQTRLRMTLDGPAGSGKTYTALRFAHALTQAYPGKIAVIDTERGSASKYVGESPDGIPWQFDTLQLLTFSPEEYTRAIVAAGNAGYSVLVIDSLSHAWEGVGGALEMKSKAGESWSAWKNVTPFHNRMVDTILQSPCHVITTMRSRMEYIPETDEKGKIVNVRKVGLAPIQRPGMEYEFDIVCDIDWDHILTVSKSRCSAVDKMVTQKPGPEFLIPVIDWLKSGVEAPPAVASHVTPQAAPASNSEVTGLTLDQLVNLFSAEAVMVANKGKIPATQEELNSVALILAGIKDETRPEIAEL